MKIGSRCGFCLLHRGYNIVLRSTEDEEVRMRAVEALLKLMGENFGPDVIPSILGIERDRLIKSITGCPDAYADLKRVANESALRLLP